MPSLRDAAGSAVTFIALGVTNNMTRIDRFFKARPIAGIVAIALGMIAGITWLDHLSGWDFSVGVLYGLPILLIAWYVRNSAWAVVIAVVCMFAWAWANKVGNPYASNLAFIWATMTRFIYFSCIAIGGAAVRRQLEADSARIAALEHTRTLERDIVTISESEQRRIGQELHDGLCQVLAGIGCAVGSVKEDLRAKSLPEAQALEEIEGFVNDAVSEARNIARGIFPVLEDAGCLVAALEELTFFAGKVHRVSISLSCDDGIVFEKPDIAMHIYRIAQEALSNALKHGKAKHITVFFGRNDKDIRLAVEDDGCGMPIAATTPCTGMGLRTMKYRAGLIGGQLEVKPGAHGGTMVRCEVPFHHIASLPLK